MLYEIKNLNKTFNQSERALKNINLTFESTGLICITGTSGSGKTTLLNMLSLLDTPTSGNVYFHGEDISKWHNKRKEIYLNKEIGILFQHYQLLEDQTVIYNVSLPALVSGEKEEYAFKTAKKLLSLFGFDESTHSQLVNQLSGGEKQRIALLRALINGPKVLLCDEPTGALDNANATMVMKTLKKASKDHLVIMVTHNIKLAEQYANRIIYLRDGEVVKDECVRSWKDDYPYNKPQPMQKRKKKWVSFLSKHNFVKRRKRNIATILSMGLSLCFTFLMIGFHFGSHKSINNECYKQLDYGNLTLTKEIKSGINESGFTLIRTTRPSKEELISLNSELKSFYITPNCDALYASMKVSFQSKEIDEIYYSPIYSFIGSSFDKNLLSKGSLPVSNSIDEVVINDAAYQLLKKKTGSDPLLKTISLKSEYQHDYYSFDDLDTVVSDSFIYQIKPKIVGIVKEMPFLNVPKIYFSQTAFLSYLNETPMENRTSYENREYSWLEGVTDCSDNDILSSYSYRLFLKDNGERDILDSLVNSFASPFHLDSSALTIKTALNSFISATNLGIKIFTIIALVGGLMIMGIISFSNYTEDRKRSAILSSFGVNKSDITDIYLNENLLVMVCGFVLSLVLTITLCPLLNFILNRIIHYSNLISWPFNAFHRIPFFFGLFLFLLVLLLTMIMTFMPILFSKKLSIKEELKNDD